MTFNDSYLRLEFHTGFSLYPLLLCGIENTDSNLFAAPKEIQENSRIQTKLQLVKKW